MALCKNISYSLSGGINVVVPSAYIKVLNYSGSKSWCVFELGYKKDKDTEQPFCVKQFSFTPSTSEESANLIKQCYEYLKTLPEFADAVDC